MLKYIIPYLVTNYFLDKHIREKCYSENALSSVSFDKACHHDNSTYFSPQLLNQQEFDKICGNFAHSEEG